MDTEPRWLRDYYGKDFEEMNPSLVQAGKRWAIVMLRKKAARGYRGIGYVLVKMRGRHNFSDHVSLHEGVASADDVKRMQATLTEYEAK